jgi:hypothetical protein
MVAIADCPVLPDGWHLRPAPAVNRSAIAARCTKASRRSGGVLHVLHGCADHSVLQSQRNTAADFRKRSVHRLATRGICLGSLRTVRVPIRRDFPQSHHRVLRHLQPLRGYKHSTVRLPHTRGHLRHLYAAIAPANAARRSASLWGLLGRALNTESVSSISATYIIHPSPGAAAESSRAARFV